MSPLTRALGTEALKLKGTLALRLCLVAPLVVVGLYVLQLSFREFGVHPVKDPILAWQGYAQSVMGLWAFLMLPLFVTLQSALLAGIEHGDRQWKHLLALPVPRQVHYLAKAVVLAGMVGLAHLALLALLPIGGWILMHTQPALALAGPPPIGWMAGKTATIFAASSLMIGLHTWIAIRWPSFTVAVATGMSATVMGFIIGQSARFGPWYPWSMPVQALADKPGLLPQVIAVSVGAGLLALALGTWDFLRREFA